jgi:uncharacterized membrane protein YhdT
LLGALVLGYLLYFSPPVRWLVSRLPFRKTVEEIDGVFRAAAEKKALVAKAAGLSLISQATWILMIYGLARAMGVAGADLWMFFIFEPIIFIVTALPISVGAGGAGVIYSGVLRHFGGSSNQAIALSSLQARLILYDSGRAAVRHGSRRAAPGSPVKLEPIMEFARGPV